MATSSTIAAVAGRALDQDSAAMIYEGLNQRQLCALLEMDDQDLKAKIVRGNVQPCGKRNGFPIYKVKDVLPWVVKPGYDLGEYIQKMPPSELPKMLTKEYWAGQRSRQEYLVKAGNLWPTEKVVEKVGEVYKLVKMSATLTTDTVERQVELTEKQREIIKSQMDGMLNELHRMITRAFADDGEEAESEDEQLQKEDDETL